MAANPSEKPDFVMVLALFLRDGRSRAKVLHRGTEEECQRTQDLVPAVALGPDDGDVIGAQTFVWPAERWAAFQMRAKGAHP